MQTERTGPEHLPVQEESREAGEGVGKTVCYERQISDTGRQLVLIETGPSSCSCEPNYNSGSS